jgi:hypothetical protein
MCDEHILFLIKGLLENLKANQTTKEIIELIKKQQQEQKSERQALHV